jgi:hypothetical protein
MRPGAGALFALPAATVRAPRDGAPSRAEAEGPPPAVPAGADVYTFRVVPQQVTPA